MTTDNEIGRKMVSGSQVSEVRSQKVVCSCFGLIFIFLYTSRSFCATCLSILFYLTPDTWLPDLSLFNLIHYVQYKFKVLT